MAKTEFKAAVWAYLKPLANPARGGTYAGYIKPLRASGLPADQWLICTEDIFNALKREYCEAHHIDPNTGANVSKKKDNSGAGQPRRLRVDKHSKADLIRNVLEHDIDATYREVGEFYGDEQLFSSSQVSTIRGEMKNEVKTKPVTTKKITTPAPKKSPKEIVEKAPIPSELESLQWENQYLRWQLEGERQGYFDRWLDDQGEKRG